MKTEVYLAGEKGRPTYIGCDEKKIPKYGEHFSLGNTVYEVLDVYKQYVEKENLLRVQLHVCRI